MDERSVNRIDSLYRNMKQLPLLYLLGILIPICMLIAVPLSFVYLYLRRKLLRDIDIGAIVLEGDSVSPVASPGGVSTSDKIKYVRENSSQLWFPPLMLLFVVVGLGLIIFFALSSLK